MQDKSRPLHQSTKAKRWVLALLTPGYKFKPRLPAWPAPQVDQMAAIVPGPQLGATMWRVMQDQNVTREQYRFACNALRAEGRITCTRVGPDVLWALAPEPAPPPPMVRDA